MWAGLRRRCCRLSGQQEPQILQFSVRISPEAKAGAGPTLSISGSSCCTAAALSKFGLMCRNMLTPTMTASTAGATAGPVRVTERRREKGNGQND
jgi:hypothetical protein